MMPVQKCPNCGALLAGAGAGSFCPACLLRLTLESPSPAKGGNVGTPAHQVLPRAFGPYELTRELGRGGMGVVYAASQPALGRTVAVKLLLSGAYSSEAALGRFRLEAAAAAGLQHPNIVAIHDYGEVDGQPYYSMDLVAGRDLSALCAGRPLASRRAAELLRLLAGAVHYAHERGVVHRDLKPSNVLVDQEGWPRIADFGLAKRLGSTDEATQTGQILGSPSYAAPEQVAGRSAASGVPGDIYGLGALFYHLLTGRAPFVAATPTETMRLVLHTDPPPPRRLNPGLPRDLEAICLKCLAKEPTRRYVTCAELADDLERYLGGRPVRARAPGVLYRLRRLLRPPSMRIALAAAAAGAAAGAAAMWPSWRTPANPATRLAAPAAEARQLVRQALPLLFGGNVVRPDLDAAAQLFEQARELDPADAEVWAFGAMTDATYYRYNYDRSDVRKGLARTKAARALQLDPHSFEARLAQVSVLNWVVETPAVRPEAARLIRTLLADRPDDRRTLGQKGTLLALEGRLEEAARCFRQADDPIAEGQMFLAAGRVADADAAIARARSAGLSARGWLLKASLELYCREDLDAAQAAIDQLPASELLEDEVAVVAVSIRLMRREPDKVLEIMRAIPRDWLTGSDAGRPKAAYTAWAHHLANRPAAARSDWQAALRLTEDRMADQPNNPSLALRKANLLASLGERDEAAQNLRLYQQLQGQRENELTLDTAFTLLLLGRRDGILDVLATALKRQPAFNTLHVFLRYHPIWDSLRGDPRFEALLRETLPQGAKPFDDPKPAASPP